MDESHGFYNFENIFSPQNVYVDHMSKFYFVATDIQNATTIQDCYEFI